jgi:hypothetical protein
MLTGSDDAWMTAYRDLNMGLVKGSILARGFFQLAL